NIERVNNYKYLGVIIDSDMSFKSHIKYLLGKLRFSTLMIYRLRKIASLKLMKLMYYSFFQSHLQYCLAAYGNTFFTNLQPLRTLQKKSVRLISGNDATMHSYLLFKNYNILPLTSLYFYRCYLYLKKHYNEFDLRTNNSSRV